MRRYDWRGWEASVYICQIKDDHFCPDWSRVPVGGAEAGRIRLWCVVFFISHVPDGSSLAPPCHLVSEELVTRLSRSDMMRSDGSFLQNSSLPLIHPYQRVNPSSYSTPLKPASHIGADQSSKQGGANKRPSCFGSNFPDWMSVRNVCVAAGRKVGHHLKDHCLVHMRPLFWLYEILSERYDGPALARRAVCFSCPLARLNKELLNPDSISVRCRVNICFIMWWNLLFSERHHSFTSLWCHSATQFDPVDPASVRSNPQFTAVTTLLL